MNITNRAQGKIKNINNIQKKGGLKKDQNYMNLCSTYIVTMRYNFISIVLAEVRKCIILSVDRDVGK